MVKDQRTDAVAIQNANPTWLTLDKKVLRFYGYYREGVHELRVETERVRRCNLYYFLEDDTMQVTEPREENSGLVQGNYIRRHRIPKKVGTTDWFSVDDFDIGREIEIYGKVFVIVECDAFTRSFYHNLGRSLRPKDSWPDDSHRTARALATAPRQTTTEHMEWKRYGEFAVGGSLKTFTKEEREAQERFLKTDRQVLRFYCVWDDPGMGGERHTFVLLYFVSDRTIKVIEIMPQSSGRDPFPVYIKRQKVPKTDTPAADCDLETLGKASRDHIVERDLGIGRVVRVFGRDFLLYDCDDFTRQYYRTNFGVEGMTPLDVSLPQPAPVMMTVPGPTGYGNEEDSLTSWKFMVLKPPRKDVAKLIRLDGKALRFGGYLEYEPRRRVILSYHLADDTLSLYEQATRNTGFTGGKFLQRQRVAKGPEQLALDVENGKSQPKPKTPPRVPVNSRRAVTLTTEYFSPQDFYVGARVCINGHWIVLDAIDENTLAYMQGLPTEFSVANVNLVLQKIREAIGTRYVRTTEAFRAVDKDHNGLLTVEEFATACRELNVDLTDHELITLMRFLDANHDGVVNYNEFVARMQESDLRGALDAPPTETTITQSADPKDLTFSRAHRRLSNAAFGERVLQSLRDRLESSRAATLDSFRIISDRAPDSRVGEPEFRKCVVERLQMNYTDEQLDALCRRIFPTPASRLTLFEFQKHIEPPHFFKKV
jgi:hypothetical protein